MSGRRLLILGVALAYVVAEIAVLVWLASMIGWLWVIAILAVQFALGVAIVRRAGVATLGHVGQAAQVGSLPGGEAGDAALMGLGGALIALPGIISDLLGVLLLIPPTRRVARRLTAATTGRYLRAAGLSTVTTTTDSGATVTRVYEGTVVEGEVVERHDEPGPGASPDSPPRLP